MMNTRNTMSTLHYNQLPYSVSIGPKKNILKGGKKYARCLFDYFKL